jgi:hypothetical protein
MKGSLTAAAPIALILAQAVISSSQSLAAAPQIVARATEVPIEKNAPQIPGHPLTSVVVTQCNLIVAVYVTMNAAGVDDAKAADGEFISSKTVFQKSASEQRALAEKVERIAKRAR